MKKKITKWTFIFLVSLSTIVSMFIACMFYEFIYKPERHAVKQFLEIQAKIERVHSVSLISGWGSLQEYTAIVTVGKERCRVWFDSYGSLIESECKRSLE
ncbi:hypothetical protein [Peribacillus sp. SCS-155]|uniref:hypothetical protein n=1 Tax=Peribacillus sedimenti TaxID=3115297 RepID=UPI0039064589